MSAPRACVLKCPATIEGRFRRPSRSGFPSQTLLSPCGECGRSPRRAACGVPGMVRCCRRIEPVSRRRGGRSWTLFPWWAKTAAHSFVDSPCADDEGLGAPASGCLRRAHSGHSRGGITVHLGFLTPVQSSIPIRADASNRSHPLTATRQNIGSALNVIWSGPRLASRRQAASATPQAR